MLLGGKVWRPSLLRSFGSRALGLFKCVLDDVNPCALRLSVRVVQPRDVGAVSNWLAFVRQVVTQALDFVLTSLDFSL